MTEPPAPPLPPEREWEAPLAERLVRNRLCGEVATPVGGCLDNCRRLVGGEKEYTFGLSDWRSATFEDAVAALEASGGRRLRPAGDAHRAGGAFIEPAATLSGIARHRARLAEFVGGGGGTVLVATGHPVLLPHYGSVVAALAAAGCQLLNPAGDGSVSYVDGVAVLSSAGSPLHTHLPDYMESMLDDLGGRLPDLVVADHGFAGAAIEAGVTTLSIADVNDPALPLAQARGRTGGVLLIDDGLRPPLFAPVTETVLADLPGQDRRTR